MCLSEIQRRINEEMEKACAIPKSFYGGTGTTATTGATSHATIHEIRARMAEAIPIMERMKRNIIDNAALINWPGMALRESLMATTMKPNKVHKHRRGQTKAYHARIQKKWTKRFGTQQVPGAFMLDNRAISLFGGAGGKTLVVHPALMGKLRRASL